MNRYHIYLLHIWIEEEKRGVVVRGALEEPHTGRRWGFDSVESLVACVMRLLAPGAYPPAGSEGQGGRERQDRSSEA